MKATLQFNIPKENMDFICATRATDIMCVLSDMDNHLYGIVKYNSAELSGEAINAIDKIRDEFLDMMAARNISLNMIE